MDLVPWLLFVHIFGAILAFGPTFTFSIIGAMGGKEPMHGNFGLRVMAAITEKRVEPLAILQGITGVALILLAKFDLTKALWLDIAIPIYLAALGFSLFVQRPKIKRMIELTSAPPAPPAAGGPAGPPPEFLALVKQTGQGGMALGVAVLVIVLLMVLKPTI